MSRSLYKRMTVGPNCNWINIQFDLCGIEIAIGFMCTGMDVQWDGCVVGSMCSGMDVQWD